MERYSVFFEAVRAATDAQLANVEWVTDRISDVGLRFDDRQHADDPTIHLYGDDSRFMLRGDVLHAGLWQIPRQLAAFLVTIRTENVRHVLDIGTYSGATVTVVAAYLSRFGLESVETIDVNDFLDPDVREFWSSVGLPIRRVLMDPTKKFTDVTVTSRDEYDLAFVDGNHDYVAVRDDYVRARRMSRLIAFHDINDAWCEGVRRVWKDVATEHPNTEEFTWHSHGMRTMGIGLAWIDVSYRSHVSYRSYRSPGIVGNLIALWDRRSAPASAVSTGAVTADV